VPLTKTQITKLISHSFHVPIIVQTVKSQMFCQSAITKKKKIYQLFGEQMCWEMMQMAEHNTAGTVIKCLWPFYRKYFQSTTDITQQKCDTEATPVPMV